MSNKKSAGFDQREYVKAYTRQHIQYRKASFNTQFPEDLQLLTWIDSQPESTSQYIRRLVKEDMQARQ